MMICSQRSFAAVLLLAALGFCALVGAQNPLHASEHSHTPAVRADGEAGDNHAPPRLAGLVTVYCILIVLASLAGGCLPVWLRLTHTRMQLLLSFVGGLMLGIGAFHLLPHAVVEIGSLDRAVWWMVWGILTMFLLIRVFRVHHHAVAETPDATGDAGSTPHDDPLCATHHGDEHAHAAAHRFSWTGVALGMTLHSLIDGIALGASVTAEAGHPGTGAALFGLSLFGVGTFLAVALHKPLDAASITAMMAAGRWSAGWQNAVNAVFALTCPLGTVLFLIGAERLSQQHSAMVGCALAFSAGVFLCISLGDLLPEMEFHMHNRLPLSVLLLLGLALAYGIRYLEPAHIHGEAVHENAVEPDDQHPHDD